MKQTHIENRLIEIEKRLKVLESLKSVKKDETDSPNESNLGTRSKIEEEDKSGQMSVDVDNQHTSDTKKRGRPRKEENKIDDSEVVKS